MYALSDYDYHLPDHLIAQHPAPERDRSRLMVVDRRTASIGHQRFDDLPDLLDPGDALVLNDTQVVAGRLLGRKETGGRVEVLVLDFAQASAGVKNGRGFVSPCLIRASKAPKVGSRLLFDGGLVGVVTERREGIQTIRFSGPSDVAAAIEKAGLPPLPPYIRREKGDADSEKDSRSYQTVYARVKGAVAAPTAGLHFTDALLDRLRSSGVDIIPITLHVGYGTFLPVRVDDIRDHRMHTEGYDLTAESAEAINRARQKGRRIVAVGTTSVRTIEFASKPDGHVRPGRGKNDLFIYPGYRFRSVGAMVTNFHLPKSTLLMLVSAFAGNRLIRDAYTEAVRHGYRFYSYGDAMLIR
jgi:S-adenosylmethionine:tRNA ribosyltransferase-isomerase